LCSKQGKDKVPHYFHSSDGAVLSWAGLWARWLDRDNEDTSGLKELLLPCPADDLEEHAVSQDVISPSNDHPGCILPVSGVNIWILGMLAYAQLLANF